MTYASDGHLSHCVVGEGHDGDEADGEILSRIHGLFQLLRIILHTLFLKERTKE